MIGWLILINSYCILHTSATVDLTLPEMQHLANHLTRDECRRLVAALHFNAFKLERFKTMEDAENALPEDVSCLKLLLEWNSDEGRGKTHEKLSLRLRQISRQDLASWLDSAVLDELQEEIKKVAQEMTESPQEQTLPLLEVFEDPDDLENKLVLIDKLWALVPGGSVVSFILGVVLTFLYLLNHIVKRYRLNTWEQVYRELKLNQEMGENWDSVNKNFDLD